MTPDRLLSAIRAALDDTERLARNAAGQGGEYDWHANGDEVLTADDMVVVSGRPTEHIARHDPAAVLRWVAADRRVFERHKAERGHVADRGEVLTCLPCSGAEWYWDGDVWVSEAIDDDELLTWPCPDFVDLADRLGIDPEETG